MAKVAFLTIAGPLVFTCGCGLSVVGDWHLARAVPSREVFAIDDAHFAKDGSFAATVTIEGKTARETGTYAFNGYQLTLRPRAGGQRRYNAVVRLGTLEVLDGERKIILKRSDKIKETAAVKEGG